MRCVVRATVFLSIALAYYWNEVYVSLSSACKTAWKSHCLKEKFITEKYKMLEKECSTVWLLCTSIYHSTHICMHIFFIHKISLIGTILIKHECDLKICTLLISKKYLIQLRYKWSVRWNKVKITFK